MQPLQEQVLRTVGQFQGNWVFVEQVFLLAGLDDETGYEVVADLDSDGFLDLVEKTEGRFLANLTPKGAQAIGLVDVTPPAGPDAPAELAPRKFLPPGNIRRAGDLQVTFDGIPPVGCLMCGGYRVGDNAFCILCEPKGIEMARAQIMQARAQGPVQVMQSPKPKPGMISHQPTALGPRKHRLASRKMKSQ